MKKINKYKSSKISQDMENLNPYSIIHELLQGLNEHLSDSIKSMDKGNLSSAKDLAQKAEKIAFSLQNCLDFKEGGEIADNLYRLYEYARQQLLLTSRGEDIAGLSAAIDAMENIREAWHNIDGGAIEEAAEKGGTS